MSRYLILSLSAFLIVFSSDASPVIFSRPGGNVSITCRCSSDQDCHGEFVRWVRFSTNGSLEVINTDSVKTDHRFSSKKMNDAEVQLTLFPVESGDTGRYYCGEKLSTHLQFTGDGTVLDVGEEVWSNRSKVVLLEWVGVSAETPESSELNRTAINRNYHAGLRCLVTGLNAPWVDVIWQSSRGRSKTGQTWVSKETDEGFSVTSHLLVPVTFKYDTYYDEEEEQEGEEWWCEIPAINITHKSIMSSLFQKREDPVLWWCPALVYSAITLSVFCVFPLIILTWHWLLYLRTGPAASTASDAPLPGMQDNEQAGVTKVHLNFKQPSRAGRRQRERRADRQTHTQIYSEVKYG